MSRADDGFLIDAATSAEEPGTTSQRRHVHRRVDPWIRYLSARPALLSSLVVLAVAVGANFMYLTGIVAADPIYQYSQLAVSTQKGLLPGYNYIDPNVGYTAQTLGHLAAENWLHGHVPWWNPFEGLGMPLAGEMQGAAFFPLVILDVASNGQVWFRLILEVLAGLSTLFLLRRLVTSTWVTVAGAICFELNGLFAWMFHAPGNPVAFAPMLILGIEQAREKQGRYLAGWPLIAIALALSIYAGFPETAYIDGLLAAVWALVRLSQCRGTEIRGYLARLTTGVACGILLAAPILVAFLTFEQNGDVAGHSGSGFGNLALSPSLHLPALLLPYAYGPIESWLAFDPKGLLIAFWGNMGGYLGASLIVIAAAGLFGRRERRLRLALGVWTAITIGRSFGFHPAMEALRLIPAERTAAFFRYANPSWTLALAVLAAFALDDLQRKRHWAPVVSTAAAFLVATAFLAAKAADAHRTLLPGVDHWPWLYASVAFGTGVAALCAVFATLRSAAWRTKTLAATMAVESIAFFIVPQFSTPFAAKIDSAPVVFLQRHLGVQRFFTFGPLQPDYGAYWQIASLSINDVPITKSYARYISTQLDDNVAPIVFTGSVVSNPSGPTPSQEFVTHFANYEYAGVKYVLMAADTPIPRIPNQQPLKTAFLDSNVRILELPNPGPYFTPEGGGCTVIGASVDRAVVRCTGQGTLLRREQYLPGWRATDGNRSLRVAPSGPVFQSVRLYPGVNSVYFRYEPPLALPSVLALLLGLATLGGVLVLRRLGTSLWTILPIGFVRRGADATEGNI